MRMARQLLEAVMNREQLPLDKAQDRAASLILESLEKEPGKAIKEASIRALFDAFVNYDGRLNGKLGNTEAVQEAIKSSQFPKITGALIHAKIMTQYQYKFGNVGILVDEVDSNSQTETIPGFTSGTGMSEVPQGIPYDEGNFGEKYSQIKNYKFGHIFSLTKELILFDKTNQLLSFAKTIGNRDGMFRHAFIVQKATDQAVSATGEAAQTSLNANGTATALYATDHSSYAEYANDNLISGALTPDNLAVAIQKLLNMKDETGEYIMTAPDTLLVGPSLLVTAWQITNAPGDPNSANRKANAFAPGGVLSDQFNIKSFNIVVSPYITDSAWYIGDFKSSLRWQWVWRPLTEVQTGNSDAAFDRDVIQRFKYSWMGGCGAIDFRTVVKSSG